MPSRSPLGGMLPAAAFNQRNRIAQTMMNIGNPPPQVSAGGMPPGMMMAPTPLKSLMGLEPGMQSGFMGGEPAPIPGYTPPAAAAPEVVRPPAIATPQPAPVDPSSLFAAPPAVPGQAPPQFAKPPVY